MDSVGLRTEDVRGVRWIIFDRPEALNALRRADIVEARSLVEEASRSLDAVAFRGVGEVSFSAGLHVEEFVDLTPELARGLIDNLKHGLEGAYEPPRQLRREVHKLLDVQPGRERLLPRRCHGTRDGLRRPRGLGERGVRDARDKGRYPVRAGCGTSPAACGLEQGEGDTADRRPVRN